MSVEKPGLRLNEIKKMDHVERFLHLGYEFSNKSQQLASLFYDEWDRQKLEDMLNNIITENKYFRHKRYPHINVWIDIETNRHFTFGFEGHVYLQVMRPVYGFNEGRWQELLLLTAIRPHMVKFIPDWHEPRLNNSKPWPFCCTSLCHSYIEALKPHG